MVMICASVTVPAGETMFCTLSKVPRRVYPRTYGGTAAEDRIMRSVAQSKGISHHDVLWVIDHMRDASIIPWVSVVEASKRCLTTRGVPCPNANWLFVFEGWLSDSTFHVTSV